MIKAVLTQLILGLDDENGVSRHVFEGISRLIRFYISFDADEYFRSFVKAQDDRWYIPEGTAEQFRDELFRKSSSCVKDVAPVYIHFLNGDMLSFPEVSAKGTISLISKNHVKEQRNIGDANYEEWRCLFPDDALYFQPEGKEPSFVVYRFYENALKDELVCNGPDLFNKAKIEAFSDSDIQCPKFLDVIDPILGCEDNYE